MGPLGPTHPLRVAMDPSNFVAADLSDVLLIHGAGLARNVLCCLSKKEKHP